LLVLWVALGEALFAPAARGGQYIEAYTDEKSYVAGDTILFYVSTDSPTYSLEIQRDSWNPQVVASTSGIAGAYIPYPPPGEQRWRGAGWPVSYSMSVPGTWATGSYLAHFVAEDGTDTYHPFIIRQPVPGSQSKVAFVMNYNTRNAYNAWGGKSLYSSWIPGDAHRAVKLSFQRPFVYSQGRGKHHQRQHNVYSQLEADGFNPEYLTATDIYKNPNVTRAYHVLVFAGHHEYVSRRVYDTLQAHHDRGGHLAFFSANDLYWQIRFEDNCHTLVCYKSYAFSEDPLYGVNNDLLTTRWSLPPLDRPAEALQGVRFQGSSRAFEPEEFRVQDSSHWMFAGTNLGNGDPLGELLAASETDYLDEASPSAMDVVLYARRDRVRPGMNPPTAYVDAAAIYYEDSPAYGFANGLGGQVFSAGSEAGWSAGLDSSSRDYDKVRRVQRNIIQHMVDAPPAPFFADYDRDGDVDLSDFIGLEDCTSGPGGPNFEMPVPWCLFTFDQDVDGDVDQADFVEFMTVYAGPRDDCNGNGVVDLEDILGATSDDCNSNGTPDECELSGGDCNANGVPDFCEPDEDCNGNLVQDICDLFAGTSRDCNLNMVPDECEANTDCNGNLVQDICDISLGTSGDCNDNLLPDECEPFDDCNGNGTQDMCDICQGTSEDCDSNSVPDECEPDVDGDGLTTVCDNCPSQYNPGQEDQDDDLAGDACDNCPATPNTSQQDTDGDAFGDACDVLGDIDHDGRITLNDFATFALCYAAQISALPPGCSAQAASDSDLNGDGVVDLNDFATFAGRFGG
jgi:hypothetical protein